MWDNTSTKNTKLVQIKASHKPSGYHVSELRPGQNEQITTAYHGYCLSLVSLVLKLVGTPHAMLVERFQIMWPDGGAPDLQVKSEL